MHILTDSYHTLQSKSNFVCNGNHVVEETDIVKQELHYHLYRNDIAEIKSHLADMQLDMAYLKMDVAIITREMAEMSALFKKKIGNVRAVPKSTLKYYR